MISCFSDTHSTMPQRKWTPLFFISGIGEGQLQRSINLPPSRLLFLSRSMGIVPRFILDIPVTLFPSNVIWCNPSLSWGTRGFKLTPVPWGMKLQGCRRISRQRQPRQKYRVSKHFMNWVSLSHRILTHVAQKNHKETEEESSHFVALMRQKVSGMNPDDVINMDWTPIPFTFPPNQTWEKKSTKTIHVCTSTTDTKRTTLAADVTGSGKLLTPFLIIKGKADRWITAKELHTYPNECIYAWQEKAWMDESMMNNWSNRCWSLGRIHGILVLCLCL